MVLGVGVVAENSAIEAPLAKRAPYGIDRREILRGFETVMLQPVPNASGKPSVGNSQIILALEPAFLASVLRTRRTISAIRALSST